MRPIVTDGVALSVRLSVSLSVFVTIVSPTTRAQQLLRWAIVWLQ